MSTISTLLAQLNTLTRQNPFRLVIATTSLCLVVSNVTAATSNSPTSPTRSPLTRVSPKEVLQWITSVGGEAAYEKNGSLIWIKDPTMIPSGNFEVVEIHLIPSDNKLKNPITDDDLLRLAALQSLRKVNIGGLPVGEGALRVLSSLPRLNFLVLERMPLSDEAVSHVANVRSLNHLWIFSLPESATFTGKTLYQLARIPGLHHVRFTYSKLNDEGLAALARVPSLKTIDVAETKVTDAGIAHLAKLRNLSSLQVQRTAVTPTPFATIRELRDLKGLGYLHSDLPDFVGAATEIARSLPQVETIHFKGPLNDAQIRSLAAFRGLKSIDLLDGPISETDCAAFGALKGLNELTFYNCDLLTDIHLMQLKSIKSLKIVNARHSKVTDAGARSLEKVIPGCKVNR